MALIAIIVLPIAFFPVFVFGKWVRKISAMVQTAMGKLNIFLHETFAGNKIVKAFGMEEYEKKRFAEKTMNLFKLEMKQVAIDALSSPVMEFLGGVGIAFIIWFGGLRVINGTSTPGTFFSFLTAVMMLYDPVKKNTVIEIIAGKFDEIIPVHRGLIVEADLYISRRGLQGNISDLVITGERAVFFFIVFFARAGRKTDP